MIQTFSFNHPLNFSLQPTDTMYGALVADGVDQVGINFPEAVTNQQPQRIGTVMAVDRTNNTVNVDMSDGVFAPGPLNINLVPGSQFFFFFSKNRAVNSSGLLGYYAEVEFRNESRKKAEIFATATEYVPSSK